MNENVKEKAAAAPIKGTWPALNAGMRLRSQLDAATGALTGDQQRMYADLPAENYSEQPSTSHKIVQTRDGAAEYRQLVNHQASWRDPATGSIVVNGAGRH